MAGNILLWLKGRLQWEGASWTLDDDIGGVVSSPHALWNILAQDQLWQESSNKRVTCTKRSIEITECQITTPRCDSLRPNIRHLRKVIKTIDWNSPAALVSTNFSFAMGMMGNSVTWKTPAMIPILHEQRILCSNKGSSNLQNLCIDNEKETNYHLAILSNNCDVGPLGNNSHALVRAASFGQCSHLHGNYISVLCLQEW